MKSATQILEMARGASDAEALYVESTEFSVTVRRGQIEALTQSRSRRAGMRLFRGSRSACSSSADLAPEALARLVADTLEMAAITSEDPAAMLPDAFAPPLDPESMGLYDEALAAASTEQKIDLAARAEAAAFAFSPEITNSEGAIFSSTLNRFHLANSRGFSAQYQSTQASLHVIPLAGSGEGMERDYWYSVSHRLAGLESPEELGRRAAARVLRRLGARKVATQQVPVVFDPESASQLLGHLSEAVSGQNVYRQSSFLMGKLGEKIFPDHVTVIDDGTIPGGLGSRPFDGDGLPSQRTVVVDQGRLAKYLNNTYTARKLGQASTGNAVRGVASPPAVGPTNFRLLPGKHAPEEIIGSIEQGLFVTELIGFGVNIVNGDFSQGLAGLWIEKGKLSYPVHEVTIAGNLAAMFGNIEMIGNDLEPRSPISCPTLRMAHLMLSGV